MGLRGPKPKTKEIIWTPQLAYAIGLITTDGCLSNDGRHLTLVSADIEQIENIRKCLGLKANVGVHLSGKRFNDAKAHRVQWGDVQLYTFLLSIGLTPKKSLILKELRIPDEYFFHFLRGCFDGDGSFYSYFDPRWKSSFMFYISFASASPIYTDWMRATIDRLTGVHGHISKKVGDGKTINNMYSLRYAKKEGLIVLKKMYQPSLKGMFLSRKRLKIVRALRIVGESL